MKSFFLGAAGALLVLIAFGLGEKSVRESRGGDRFQMHVSTNGDVVRLDKRTGKLHAVTSGGIGDLPEQLGPPGVATATASPAHQ